MADFKKALEKTLRREGGYVDDPVDAGGETYKGVSRRYNPSWPGWKVIDRKKGGGDFPVSLDDDPDLQLQVRNLYKQDYWDKFMGDEIPEKALEIAVELFDTGINLGVGRAVKYLQRGLNLLNRNGRSWKDIVVDGSFGLATLAALEKYSRKDKPGYLLKIMNILQGNHYINYMTRSPVQEKYARGWLNRVTIYKSDKKT